MDGVWQTIFIGIIIAIAAIYLIVRYIRIRKNKKTCHCCPVYKLPVNNQPISKKKSNTD